MIHVKQNRGEKTCGQCCVAMALRFDREEVIDALGGHRSRTRPKDLRQVLEANGRLLLPAKRFKVRSIPESLPDSAILKMHIHHNDLTWLHYVYLEDGKIYCPDASVEWNAERINWREATNPKNREKDPGYWLTSYLEIVAP